MYIAPPLSCALKALASTEVGNFVEILRQSCGGHGYMASSNFPRLYCLATAAETIEGENTVLWLQTARYGKNLVRLMLLDI